MSLCPTFWKTPTFWHVDAIGCCVSGVCLVGAVTAEASRAAMGNELNLGILISDQVRRGK
jgi:hypothetical protein